MKRIIILIALCLLVLTTTAQNVTNTHFVQEGKMVKIYFDLSKKADVSIYLSTNGGRSYETSPLGHMSGNVGEKVRPGKKRCAVWDVTADRENLSCDSICFKVVAREHFRKGSKRAIAAAEAAAAAAEARRLEEERLKAEATAKRALAQREKRIFTVGDVTFTMIHVQGGTFSMGCTSEQSGDCYENDVYPVHSVTLSDFWIGETEVTQALWRAVMGIAPLIWETWMGDNLPADCVSWYNAQEFCRKLSQQTGCTFRLPTEAEWEYAARGGNKSHGYKYSGSNSLSSVAWYSDNSGVKPEPVKSKYPNELGLYDMSGNVWEWCEDWYGPYDSNAQFNPTGSLSGSERVLRAGGRTDQEWICIIAYRNHSNPSVDGSFGLRVVLAR